MAWRRGTRVSLSTIAPSKTHLTAPARPTLLTALRSFDSTFAINRQKPYQTVNDAGFEVTLLAAPSTQPLPVQGAFEPMAALTEQEWLLKGNPVRCIVATKDNHACPLYVPDPRWMAAHKLWLARQSQRETPKKEMGDGQGKVLLDATRYFLRDSYPLDLDFVLELPPELRDLFNEWAESSGFDPTQRD